VLTREDLPAMLGSGKLFARKFEADQDSGVLEALERKISFFVNP
jgi:hypothetical protein